MICFLHLSLMDNRLEKFCPLCLQIKSQEVGPITSIYRTLPHECSFSPGVSVTPPPPLHCNILGAGSYHVPSGGRLCRLANCCTCMHPCMNAHIHTEREKDLIRVQRSGRQIEPPLHILAHSPHYCGCFSNILPSYITPAYSVLKVCVPSRRAGEQESWRAGPRQRLTQNVIASDIRRKICSGSPGAKIVSQTRVSGLGLMSEDVENL